jgi:hypothetical protein
MGPGGPLFFDFKREAHAGAVSTMNFIELKGDRKAGILSMI